MNTEAFKSRIEEILRRRVTGFYNPSTDTMNIIPQISKGFLKMYGLMLLLTTRIMIVRLKPGKPSSTNPIIRFYLDREWKGSPAQ